jgi:starvation-inducible DNA-binding protein
MALKTEAKRNNVPRVKSDVDIGLDADAREQVVGVLTKLLADEFVLHTKTRAFHWNVTGPHFNALHELFEEQYTALNVTVDDVAERIRQLGALTKAGLGPFLDQARLDDAEGHPGWQEMLKALLADHEAVIRQLRDDVETCEEAGDQGTMDFLTGLMEQHEKTAWMLRAHLES